MGPATEHLLDRVQGSPLSWDPAKVGKRGRVVFEDDKIYDLGPDGAGFDEVAARMLGGCYYPTDAIRVYGYFQAQGRPIQIGDRLLQQAPLLLGCGGPVLNAGVEVIEASMTKDECQLGYVTTEFHFGKGVWNARLYREKGRLLLRVWSTTLPGSWLFWVALPIARWYQLRARRRAVQEFRKVVAMERTP